MTDLPGIITAVFAGIGVVMLAAAQAYQIIQGHKRAAQLDGIAHAVDGLSDKRDAATAKSSHAEGVLEGEAKQRAQPLVAAAAPMPAPLTAEQQQEALLETIKTAQAQLDALKKPPAVEKK